MAEKSAEPVGRTPGRTRNRLSLQNENLLNSEGGSEQLEGVAPLVNTKDAEPENKAMPDDVPATDAPPEGAMPDEAVAELEGAEPAATEEPAELYGAQLIRRMHRDAAVLMQDYDRLAQQLEEQSVKAHVQSKIETLEKDMQALEELFSSIPEYKDYPMLDGALDPDEDEYETKDADGEGEEAAEGEPFTGEEEEEPTEEEALEGMQAAEGKSLTAGQWRAKMLARRKAFPKMNDAPPDELSRTEDVDAALSDASVKKGGAKDLTEGELLQTEEELNQRFADTEEDKGLQPHEKEHVRGAHGFLKELSETHDTDWSEEHRKNAYHHAKLLEPLGAAMAAVDPPVKALEPDDGLKAYYDQFAPSINGITGEMQFPGKSAEANGIVKGGLGAEGSAELGARAGEKGAKGDDWGPMTDPSAEGVVVGGTDDKGEFVGDRDYWQGEAAEEEHGPDHGAMRQAIAAASKHLKDASEKREWGEDDRKESLLHHKALEPFATAEELVDVQEGGEPDPSLPEPGTMGEKATGHQATSKPGYSHAVHQATQSGNPGGTVQAPYLGPKQRGVAAKPPKPKTPKGTPTKQFPEMEKQDDAVEVQAGGKAVDEVRHGQIPKRKQEIAPVGASAGMEARKQPESAKPKPPGSKKGMTDADVKAIRAEALRQQKIMNDSRQQQVAMAKRMRELLVKL